MKITLFSFIINLLLPFVLLRNQAAVITRFPQLSVIFLRSWQETTVQSDTEQSDPITKMTVQTQENLCKSILKAKIYMYENDSMNNIISTFVESKTAEINENNDKKLNFEKATIKVDTNIEKKLNIFTCYSSKDIKLLISTDFISAKGYFVYYSDLSDQKYTYILGFLEPVPSIFPSKDLVSVFKHLINLRSSTFHGCGFVLRRKEHFCNLFEDEGHRMCSLAVDIFKEENKMKGDNVNLMKGDNANLKSYIINAKILNADGKCKNEFLNLFAWSYNYKTYILRCRLHIKGTSKRSFYLIPDPAKKGYVYLVSKKKK